MNPGIWWVLGIFWVIAAFPAAVLIGRATRGSAAREPVTLTGEQAERLWRAVHSATAVCAHCPDCGCEMQDEGSAYWCPYCQAAVTHDRIRAEGG